MKKFEKTMWNYGFFRYIEKRTRKKKRKKKILPPG